MCIGLILYDILHSWSSLYVSIHGSYASKMLLSSAHEEALYRNSTNEWINKWHKNEWVKNRAYQWASSFLASLFHFWWRWLCQVEAAASSSILTRICILSAGVIFIHSCKFVQSIVVFHRSKALQCDWTIVCCEFAPFIESAFYMNSFEGASGFCSYNGFFNLHYIIGKHGCRPDRWSNLPIIIMVHQPRDINVW